MSGIQVRFVTAYRKYKRDIHQGIIVNEVLVDETFKTVSHLVQIFQLREDNLTAKA